MFIPFRKNERQGQLIFKTCKFANIARSLILCLTRYNSCELRYFSWATQILPKRLLLCPDQLTDFCETPHTLSPRVTWEASNRSNRRHSHGRWRVISSQLLNSPISRGKWSSVPFPLSADPITDRWFRFRRNNDCDCDCDDSALSPTSSFCFLKLETCSR